ncbi:MAG: hypothetical protein BWX88_02112 [Planctomycetes bacterium ADurb.Bin126]|nr:MAG: hypothetical protein BWX88_02112 [Planctomycetes bacterium ADurb.Bin126]HOD83050.1 hypothetical protein [Phycisphaerae bacterium]HQL74219.1 hypothetical protein [Phycisphaerae bacterium]
MRKNITRIILVVAIGALAYLLSYLGLGPWGGGGRKDGGPSATRPATTQPTTASTRPAATQPATPNVTRPLEIVIEDRAYLVAGKAVSLEEIEQMLGRIPDGPGPAVMVNRRPSSRAETEVALKLKLQEKNVTSSWSPPL